MSKTKPKRQWYHSSSRCGFEGIFHLTLDEFDQFADASRSVWGPFRTFTQAKNDAIDYFRCDKRDAELAIAKIKETKKPKDNQ